MKLAVNGKPPRTLYIEQSKIMFCLNPVQEEMGIYSTVKSLSERISLIVPSCIIIMQCYLAATLVSTFISLKK
jgi:hypothetical protein